MIGDMLAVALHTVRAEVSGPFHWVVVKPVMTAALVLPVARPHCWPLLS